MKFCTDIHGAQGMNLHYFGNPLTFPVAPSAGHKFMLYGCKTNDIPISLSWTCLVLISKCCMLMLAFSSKAPLCLSTTSWSVVKQFPHDSFPLELQFVSVYLNIKQKNFVHEILKLHPRTKRFPVNPNREVSVVDFVRLASYNTLP